jgi:hypothetical protein
MNRFIWMACVGALCAAPSASALIIDFEGHPDDGAPTIFHQGYTFTFAASGWGVFTDGFVGGGAPYTHNGTTRLVAAGDNGGNTGRVTFKPTDDSAFNLVRFDSATFFPDIGNGQIEVIGNIEGGGSVSTTINITPTFTAYNLPGTFVNLDNVVVRTTISGGYRAEPGFSLDNINVSAVPEPATMAALGLGVAALIRRRRK